MSHFHPGHAPSEHSLHVNTCAASSWGDRRDLEGWRGWNVWSVWVEEELKGDGDERGTKDRQR